MERMNRRIERNKNRNHNGNQNEKRHRKRSRGNMKAENARISAVRLYLHYISIHIRSAMLSLVEARQGKGEMIIDFLIMSRFYVMEISIFQHQQRV